MLDNDPRYLRPDSRLEMDQRISSLVASPTRNRTRQQAMAFRPPYTSTPAGQGYAGTILPPGSGRRVQSYDIDPSLTTSSGITEGIRNLSIPVRGEDQENIPALAFDDDDSYLGVRDIQRRVSDCSTIYAKQISTLLRRFSISSTSDAEDEEQQSEHRPSSGVGSLAGSPGPSGDALGEGMTTTFPNPGYALPGDYLKAHRWRCTDISHPDHAAGRCWCSVARETSSVTDSWFLPTGQLSEHGRMVLTDPAAATVFLSDHFGNTPLHLIASLEGYRQVLFGMVFHGANVRATNKGHQTFLHVLNEEWFSDLSGPSAPLKQLLTFLLESAPDLVYETDLYGRTFFHRARSLILDPDVLTGLLSPFHPIAASRRDAFGFTPLPNPLPNPATSRQGSLAPFEEDSASPNTGTTGPNPSEKRPSSADEVSFLAYHARLVQVIQSSYNDAHVEDSEGRNGLHCLAEAIINQQNMDEQRSVMSTGRSLKRKVDLTDTVTPPPASSSRPTPSNPIASNTEGTLLARLRHLEGLTIHSTHPVDINHYDKAGNTALMAFITHIPDDQDDKSKTLVAILETLVHAGARLEARNRRGETALLVAARLGRKAALTTLLENGANVYARDVRGRGILEVVDERCRGAGGDVALYARLEACRVLVTGRRDWGVVGGPGGVLEWGRG